MKKKVNSLLIEMSFINLTIQIKSIFTKSYFWYGYCSIVYRKIA